MSLRSEASLKAYRTGIRLMNENKLDEAEKYLSEAIMLTPDFLGALDSLGIVYRRQGQYEKAEKVYQHALKVDDTLIVTYSCLALVYRQMNRMEDMVKMYTKIYEINPEKREVYLCISALFQEVGNDEKSKQYFHIAMEKYGKQKTNLISDTFYALGNNHYEVNEYHDALYCYEQAEKAYPNDEILKEHIAEVRKILNKE